MLHAIRKDCPECHVTLTRYQWSQLWWMSSGLSGRLVQPCSECGAKLKLSAMKLLSIAGALSLMATSGIMFMTGPTAILLAAALVCTLIMLGGVLGTRIESVPDRRVLTDLPGHPEAAPRPSR
jgi:hypothetical protein